MIMRAEYDLRRYQHGLLTGIPISSRVLPGIGRSNGSSPSG